ncbi:hypothetical protein [Amycolatopsis jejuensis]|uniref:hypothetical protein n=1 Tax=Amycolatopsis jejuensis TaxID=330084 RepID=UPI0005278315|nr:hypothetical protein [Amycolatopsis jejuensis]
MSRHGGATKKRKHDSGPERGAEAPSAGGQAPGGYDDGGAITEPLKPPEISPGEDIQALVKDAGVEVMAVEWIYEKLTGHTLTEQFIKPITGDFSKISGNAEAWRNVATSIKAFSTVMTGNEKVLAEHWTGPAALAHRAYVDGGWRAALTAEAGIAELIAKGFELLAETSKKLAAKALDLLRSLIDRLLVMAAEACVPIAGWIADAITGLTEILPLINALLSIIEMIKDIIEKVGEMWSSIKDLGSQLAKIKDVRSMGDLMAVGKEVKGTAGDIAGDVKDIGKSTREIGEKAWDGAKESTKQAHKNAERRASGRISGSIDD